MHFSTLLSGAALFQLSIAGYVLEDDYMKDFYGSFDFFTAPDPTEGMFSVFDMKNDTNWRRFRSVHRSGNCRADRLDQCNYHKPGIVGC